MLDTLDLQSFMAEWTVLLERFGREPSNVVALGYYESLKVLTLSQFKFAARRVFVECDTLPSPRRILEMVIPPAKDRAVVEWDAILTAISRGKDAELSETGFKALRSVGGRTSVGQCNIMTEMPHMRRNFIEAYVSFDRISSMPAIGPSEPVASLPESNESNLKKLREMAAQIGGGSNGNSVR